MTISLVATSHGTRVPEAREAITSLIDGVRASAPHLDVYEAFVDVQDPYVGDVVEQIDGAAVVVPLLLAPGFHVDVDIVNATTRPKAAAARTLGPDPRLTRVLLKRLAEVGATRDDVIVLAGAGSTNDVALRSVDAAARLLGTAWGSPIPVGHVGGKANPIEDVVRDVARSGRRVVVASYLMAPGFFFDRLTKCGADVVTRPLLDGPEADPDLVSLVIDRYAEAADLLDQTHAARERWM
ncbi:sirohydrochlorin chelatase [Aeromicrobium sp.]|uniref:sirohydrochlorin chelatase n=1 Tax=Aeromicrobium sp. TaxID=1871063 RepID=UPI002FCB4DC8